SVLVRLLEDGLDGADGLLAGVAVGAGQRPEVADPDRFRLRRGRAAGRQSDQGEAEQTSHFLSLFWRKASIAAHASWAARSSWGPPSWSGPGVMNPPPQPPRPSMPARSLPAAFIASSKSRRVSGGLPASSAAKTPSTDAFIGRSDSASVRSRP